MESEKVKITLLLYKINQRESESKWGKGSEFSTVQSNSNLAQGRFYEIREW